MTDKRVCYRRHLDRPARQRLRPGRRRAQFLVSRRTRPGAGRRDLPAPPARTGSAGRGRRRRSPPARLTDIDLFDERSLAAAVRDAVAEAQPVPRTAADAGATSRYGRRRDRGACDVVAAGRRPVGAAGPHGVPAGVVVGAPGDRVAGVLRRRRRAHRSPRSAQLGTEVAVLVYFARDIVRIVKAWFNGLFVAAHRDADYRLGWYVIIGTIPIGVLGLLFKDEIRTGARNLWLIATRIDRLLRGDRRRRVLRQADPSRRTAHLARQRDRRSGAVPGAGAGGVAVRRDDQRGPVPRARSRTRRPIRLPAGDPRGVRLRAVLAARRVRTRRRGDERHRRTASGGSTLIAFVVGFAAVAWFLRFLVRHSMYWFVGYRVVLGTVVLILLGTGVVAAT